MSSRGGGAGSGWVRITVFGVMGVVSGLAVATGLAVGRLPGAFLAAAPFYLVAVLVLGRIGSHPVAWLLLSIGVTLQVTTFDALPWLPPIWIGWLTGWGFPALFAQFAWLLILFPDGFAPRRWRRAGFLAMAMVPVALLARDITDSSDNNAYLGPNPTGLGWFSPGVELIGYVVIAAVLVAATAHLFVRSRRSEQAVRLRYRPVLASLVLLALAVTFAATTAASPRLYQMVGGTDMWGAVLVVYMLIPVGFGVAITRYRLYDIDKIISRTVTYALVVAIVALVYAVPVVLVSSVVGGSRALVTAAATLAAAAVFNPVRRQIQQRVDRRFDRARYDAEREVAAFAAQLGPRHSIDGLTGELTDLLQRTLHPETSRLWLRSSAGVDSRNDSGTHHA